MKKFWAMVVLYCVLLPLFAASAKGTDTHWNDWTPVEDGKTHISTFEETGETRSAACHNTTIDFGTIRKSICLYCGRCPSGTFQLIEGATAEPVDMPAKPQNGTLIARGLARPFAEDVGILYAFTIAYEENGGIASFKNKSTVRIPLPKDLPEGVILQRVNVISGDDSTSPTEKRIDTNYTIEGGMLTFISKSSTLYILRMPMAPCYNNGQ